jgi:hypothetical protein
LLLDIKKIQPEGEEHCAFGDLFDDELVEQVSCSAVDAISICLDRQQTSVNRITFLCINKCSCLLLTCVSFVPSHNSQYYEALVGTLKAAKRKGLIKFKGQMFFKGMHDCVQINIAN